MPVTGATKINVAKKAAKSNKAILVTESPVGTAVLTPDYTTPTELGAVVAEGTDGRIADAAHVHTHGNRTADGGTQHDVAQIANAASDAEVTAALDAHKDLDTGVHGAGASTLATEADIATHAALNTGVHGAGASTLATAADIATHTALPNAHHDKAHDHTTGDGSGVLTNDEHDGYSEYASIVAPASPAAGLVKLYNNGGYVYAKDSDGNIHGPLYHINNTLTVLGDIVYRGTLVSVRLPGNTTTTRKFLRQTGTGAVSAAPGWDTLLAADVPDLSATYVPKSLFDAYSILMATANDTPVALAVAEQTLLGRITGGAIAALTAAQVKTLLALEADPALRRFPIHINGGGAAIATGIAIEIPDMPACTVEGWTLVGSPSGSLVLDLWSDSYANHPPTVADTMIATGTKPTLSAGVKAQDLTVDWADVTIAAGATLTVNVDSAATVEFATLTLRLRMV